MSNLIQPSAYSHYDFVNFSTDNLKVVLLSSAYVYSASHINLSDIAAGIVATSGNLTGAANTNGLLAANGPTFSALTGAQVTQAFLYHDTGTSSTSTLIAYLNQGPGWPLTPDGTDKTLSWSGAGIAQI